MLTDLVRSPVVVTGLAIAVAASLVGVFVILRRMALVSDALSHVALPGVGLALLWHRDPFVGALVFLLAAVWLVYALERRTRLAAETIVGVLFTTALAIGALVTPSEDLLEALFGNIARLHPADAWLAAAGSALLVATTAMLFGTLARATIVPDVAHSEGVRVGAAEAVYLVMLAVAVAIGIKIVGTLMMGALIILPASTAKNLAPDLRTMAVLAVVLGTVTTGVGLGAAITWHWPSGPAVVLANAALFLVSAVRGRPAWR